MVEPKEESAVLHHRGRWPRPVNQAELEKLKSFVAWGENFPRISTPARDEIDKTSEEYVNMEETLSWSHIAVIRSEISELQTINRMFIIQPLSALNMQVYRWEQEDMSDLAFEFGTNDDEL